MFHAIRFADGAHCVAQLNDEVNDFFAAIESVCKFSPWGNDCRIRVSGVVENSLTEHFLELEKHISVAAEKVTNDSNRNEILDLGRRLKGWRISINEFLEQSLRF